MFTALARDGKTVIVVTHDLDVARWMGRVITLADGALQSDRGVAFKGAGQQVAHV